MCTSVHSREGHEISGLSWQFRNFIQVVVMRETVVTLMEKRCAKSSSNKHKRSLIKTKNNSSMGSSARGCGL